LESVAQTGRYRDQPSLNAALFDTKAQLTRLSNIFNAQFKTTPKAAKEAVVWHFYSSYSPDDVHTPFELLVNDLVKGSSLDRGRVEGIVRSDHPWRREIFIDEMAAARIFRRDRFDGWEAAWLKRDVYQSFRRRTRCAFDQIRRLPRWL
jgi:hypothetical protein